MEVDELATVDPSRGLSAAEVQERRRRGEVNDVPAAPTRTIAQIVRANVFTRFNALLGAMLALIVLVGGPYQDALFGVVLVANALIGIVQEIRAKRTLDRLTLLTAPRAHVVRDGSVSEVPVGEVVLDDVLDAPAGAQIVVDGEVVRADGFEVDESLLTGESDPVRKRPGDPVLSGVVRRGGVGSVPSDGDRGRRVRDADRPRRPALHAHALRAPRRHRSDPPLRHVGHRADGGAAVREPVPRPRFVARGRLRCGRRHGRDGSRRARAADLAGVRGRGRPAGATAGAGPGAAGRRGARPGRRAVHRQDRHAHRGPAGDRACRPRFARPIPLRRWPRWRPPIRRRTRRCGRSPRPTRRRRTAGGRTAACPSLPRGSGAPRRSAATGRGCSARPTCSWDPASSATASAPRPRPATACCSSRGPGRSAARRSPRSASRWPRSSWPIGSAATPRRRSRTSPNRASR